jgi:16S rRNA (guanine527-N7)-methyltransferase
MTDDSQRVALRLNVLLTGYGLDPLDQPLAERFAEYCELLLRWNARVNLTAIRDEEGILSRHFVESIVCAHSIPTGIGTLLDFGSGAGFPGLPIALCRPEIAVTLAESQGKKATFLREAARSLGIEASIHSGRAEVLHTQFDCVTLRAVDRMAEAVKAASLLVAPEGWLVLLTTGSEASKLQLAAGVDFSWGESIALPGGEDRLIALGQRSANTPA